MKYRIVFIGNELSEFSSYFLSDLSRMGHHIVLVIGCGSRKGGRKGLLRKIQAIFEYYTLDELIPALVASFLRRLDHLGLKIFSNYLSKYYLSSVCEKNELKYMFVNSLKSDECYDVIKRHSPDLLFVHSCSQIISENILSAPKVGAFNFHPGHLPFNRGPNPIEWAVMRRETKITATCHWMVKDVDAGDIALSIDQSIQGSHSWTEIKRIVMRTMSSVLSDFLNKLSSGILPRTRQLHQESQYFPRMKANQKYEVRKLAKNYSLN